jgi:hypothetical protein
MHLSLACICRACDVSSVLQEDQGQEQEQEQRLLVDSDDRINSEFDSSMANLAATYLDQGRWEEAKVLKVQVMKMRKRVLGTSIQTR